MPDRDELVVEQRLEIEPAPGGHGSCREAEVGHATLDRLENAAGQGIENAKVDARMRLRELPDQPRQKAGGDGGEAGDGQATLPARDIGLEFRHSVLDRVEHPAGHAAEHLACGGRREVSCIPIEQSDPEPRLETGDLPRQRGRREVQSLGRGAKGSRVQKCGHGPVITQDDIVAFHARIINKTALHATDMLWHLWPASPGGGS